MSQLSYRRMLSEKFTALKNLVAFCCSARKLFQNELALAKVTEVNLNKILMLNLRRFLPGSRSAQGRPTSGTLASGTLEGLSNELSMPSRPPPQNLQVASKVSEETIVGIGLLFGTFNPRNHPNRIITVEVPDFDSNLIIEIDEQGNPKYRVEELGPDTLRAV